jgi:arginine N-succinyltransferase
MLEHEGFVFDRYIDIFDGGPTVTAATDQIRTIRESTAETVAEIGPGGTAKVLLASGRLTEFRAGCASVKRVGRKGICVDEGAAELLDLKLGDQVVVAPK